MDSIQGLSYSNKNKRGETSDLKGDVLLTARGPYCHNGQGKMVAAPPAHPAMAEHHAPGRLGGKRFILRDLSSLSLCKAVKEPYSNKPLMRTDLSLEQK